MKIEEWTTKEKFSLLELACMASVPVRANRNRAARKSFFALEQRKQSWGAKKTSIGKGGGGGRRVNFNAFLGTSLSKNASLPSGRSQMDYVKCICGRVQKWRNQGRKTSGWRLHWKKNFLCSERDSNPRLRVRSPVHCQRNHAGYMANLDRKSMEICTVVPGQWIVSNDDS